MSTPIERLRNLNKLHKGQVSKATAMVSKMKDQAEAAAKVSAEIRAEKE